jgi:hypothetical protein
VGACDRWESLLQIHEVLRTRTRTITVSLSRFVPGWLAPAIEKKPNE